MKRHKVSFNKSKKIFKSTAKRTHKKNVRRNMSRGGIRL